MEDLQKLYSLTLEAARKVSENNVLMLCVDGLGVNVPSLKCPKLSTVMLSKAYRYTNAYSCSTSTFESLGPAYSENNDLRTQYYKSSEIQGDECRFIVEAKKQGRNIYFYTHTDKFIEDEAIKRPNTWYLTTTELLWHFLLDAVDETNGLFYVHSLFETHFSYINPYTKETLVPSAMGIIFDYLERVGGKLRADYKFQHEDGLRYVDDTWAPIIDLLKCRILFYADHGFALDFPQSTKLTDIEGIQFSCPQNAIRIPMIVISPEWGVGANDNLISLMEFNNIVISLLNKQSFDYKPKPFVKVQRSEIYNPEIRFLLKKADKEKELMAFEAFIFTNGLKLIIYSNGEMELYNLNDERNITKNLLEKVRDKITVLG